MPRPGLTREPCHGCGTTTEHRKKMLCNTCQTTLRAGEQFIAQQRADITKRPYRMGYQVPFIPYGGSSWQGSTWSRNAQILFTTLIDALGKAPAAYHPDDTSGDYLFPPDERINHYEPIWHRIVLLEPETAAAIHELYVTLYLLIRQSYAQGKHDGAHLLNQLASGDVTVAQFNEQTMIKNIT